MFSRRLRSLIFFHVAKTGGTSATARLRPLFANSATSNGNLSAACLASYPGAGDTLFHGHPEHGIAWAVPRGVVTATLLRAPDEQAVSNYLHLLRNPQLPLHGMAVRLGFSSLMAAHWPLLAFQAISLDVALSTTHCDTPADFLGRMPDIRRFLDRIDVVGCLDQLNTVLHDAAQRTGHPVPPLAPRLNTAAEFGTEWREVERLRAEYHALAVDPVLRQVMEAEAMLVARARARCVRRLKSWLPPVRESIQNRGVITMRLPLPSAHR
ncbi:MAG: hypothetical protein ACRYG8_50005 [Janthinobacterium lividum]